MPDLQAISHARGRGNAVKKKLNKLFRLQLLLCGVLIMSVGHTALKLRDCHQRVSEPICQRPKRVAEVDLKVNTTTMEEKVTGQTLNTFMEKILEARDWEGAEDADPIQKTKNIKRSQLPAKSSPLTEAVLCDFTMSRNEASEIFNDATYKALLDSGIYSSF